MSTACVEALALSLGTVSTEARIQPVCDTTQYMCIDMCVDMYTDLCVGMYRDARRHAW